MLINALNNYYGILAEDGRMAPDGFCIQKIHYKVLLNADGGIDGIIDCRDVKEETDKKGKIKTIYEPKDFVFPKRNGVPGIAAEILDHRSKYIFGINYNSKTNGLEVERINRRDKLVFDVFKEKNLEFIKEIDTPLVNAYRKFMESWNPENELKNCYLLSLGKDLNKYSYCFAMSGNSKKMLQDDESVKKRWEALASEVSDSEYMGVCSVTGKKNVPIARIHNNRIKGIFGGQAAGCVLVGTNNPAEESYGKKQAYNSSVSEECALKYTSALNFLTSSKHHKILIDDMTVLFWAEDKKDDEYSDLFSSWLTERESSDDVNKSIENIFVELKKGRKVDVLEKSGDVTFYIVGITPNNSRLSVRFVYKDSFGKILDGIYRHYEDTMLNETKRQITLPRIKRELVSPKSTSDSKNAKVCAALSTEIIKSIIFGGKYPAELLNTLVRRVKTDKYENEVRIGLIKACINRKKGKDEIKMSLDLNNTNPAYLCGRLFAVLERIQISAAFPTKLNRTIKDAYFTAACANPSRVMPKIMKLSEHHTAKLEKSVWYDKLKGEILAGMGDKFPGTLNISEQGTFIIGYYQQKQTFFEKNEDKQ